MPSSHVTEGGCRYLVMSMSGLAQCQMKEESVPGLCLTSPIIFH